MMHVAIAGKAGSGKSTAAKWLRDTHGYTIMSLAGKLKDLCSLHAAVLAGSVEASVTLHCHIADLVPEAPEPVFADTLEAFRSIPVADGKPRRLLQVVGTDIIRAARHDALVSYLIRTARDNERIVVDDVRFRDEFRAFSDAGWLTVFCTAPPAIREQRLVADYGKPLTTAEKTHPSECDLDVLPLDAWGYVLNTAGSMASERDQVDDMVAWIEGREYV